MLLRFIIPPVVLVGAYFVAQHIINTAPEPMTQPVMDRSPIVEVKALQRESYTVDIRASGTVRARTQTQLTTELAGRITAMSANFEIGGYFDRGEEMVRLDTANYDNAIAIAQSEAQAHQYALQQLASEEATTRRSSQLLQHNLNLAYAELERVISLWEQRLIPRNTLDAEEQRVNQLRQQAEELQGRLDTYPSRRAAIQANMNTAQARIDREQLNLGRTRVYAPYDGRVLEKRVDVGQYVSPGSVLGVVYSTDYVEVDLPMSLGQFALLDVPESFRDRAVDPRSLPSVEFTSTVNPRDTWEGQVVRTSAALDEDSRQITVIARIANPYDSRSGVSAPVRIGQFLNARIRGQTFNDVFILPPVAVRNGREILLLRDGKVDPVAVEVLWSNEREVVVRPLVEVAEGEQVIRSALAQATAGMVVRTVEQQRAAEAARAQGQGMGGMRGGMPGQGMGQGQADPERREEHRTTSEQSEVDAPPPQSSQATQSGG